MVETVCVMGDPSAPEGVTGTTVNVYDVQLSSPLTVICRGEQCIQGLKKCFAYRTINIILKDKVNSTFQGLTFTSGG